MEYDETLMGAWRRRAPAAGVAPAAGCAAELASGRAAAHSANLPDTWIEVRRQAADGRRDAVEAGHDLRPWSRPATAARGRP